MIFNERNENNNRIGANKQVYSSAQIIASSNIKNENKWWCNIEKDKGEMSLRPNANWWEQNIDQKRKKIILIAIDSHPIVGILHLGKHDNKDIR